MGNGVGPRAALASAIFHGLRIRVDLRRGLLFRLYSLLFLIVNHPSSFGWLLPDQFNLQTIISLGKKRPLLRNNVNDTAALI